MFSISEQLPRRELPGEDAGEGGGEIPQEPVLPEDQEQESESALPGFGILKKSKKLKPGTVKVSFGSCVPGDSAPAEYTEAGTVDENSARCSDAEANAAADAEHDKHAVMINPIPDAAQALYEYMKSVVAAEMDLDQVQIPVVPMWRVTGMAGLETLLPDETVPPPPMPPTPVPPLDPIAETDVSYCKKPWFYSVY